MRINPKGWRLYVITDPALARGRSHVEVVRAALAGGAGVIQLRDKQASARALVEVGQALRELTRAAGALLIINDRLDIALAVEADGVHLGQEDVPVAIARRLLGPERILGVSVDTVTEAQAAVAAGADYLGAGAVYPTGTKEDAVTIGQEGLASICRAVTVPVIAIGGIKHGRAAPLIRAGVTGVAVVSAVVGAKDITAATQALLQEIKEASGDGDVGFASSSVNA